MKQWVADKTRRVRYRTARLLVPGLHSLLNLQCRPMIHYVKEKFDGKPLVGCEIGVAAGKNAKSILETLNIEKIYLVDPYQPYYDHGRYWSRYVDTERLAHQRLRKYEDQTVWLHMKSAEASSHIGSSLDFVYIDGDHTYSYCYDDIQNFYPKVKSGGVIGGHNFQAEYPGVVRAVSEFCFRNKLKYRNSKVDWWIVKKNAV